MTRQQVVLSGHRTPNALNAIEQGVVDQCLARGLDCLLVPNLYHIPESSGLWQELAARLNDGVLLCWLHPRPARCLLQRHQIAGQKLTILNLAGFSSAASVVRAVAEAMEARPKSRAKAKQPAATLERLGEPGSERWYPVLDGSRCVNCQHCLQFCLFGVYELDVEGKVAVCNPDQCKPGCPACSRICPQSAIMFPLYEKDPAIAGAPGEFVTLDADARKMFYTRTQRPCPLCGQTADAKPVRKKAPKGVLCPECGRPGIAGDVGAAVADDVGVAVARPPRSGSDSTTAAPTEGVPPALQSHRLPYDDLDELVDRLDQQMQRRR
jgi:Pyruvate/2-oxoacid:ferredoxin oxidoreductase delta subunit